MKTNNTPLSFRCRPKSSGFNDILDSGLRRNDGKKLTGQQWHFIYLKLVCSHHFFDWLKHGTRRQNGGRAGGCGSDYRSCWCCWPCCFVCCLKFSTRS